MQTRTIITKVVGVTFEDRQSIISQLKGGEPCRIVAEPDNKFDKNALGVWVALESGEVKQVGYISRDLAADIAPRLDGEAVTTTVREVTGGFETWDGGVASLGLRILVEYPDELSEEADDDSFFTDAGSGEFGH